MTEGAFVAVDWVLVDGLECVGNCQGVDTDSASRKRPSEKIVRARK